MTAGNPGFQPGRKRLLFVCTANQHRSRTAEDLYRSNPLYEVLSGGTDVCPGEPDERPVTRTMVDWADMIFVMEDRHRSVLAERFPGAGQKTIVLGIPDRFCRGDRRLIEMLRKRLSDYLQV